MSKRKAADGSELIRSKKSRYKGAFCHLWDQQEFTAEEFLFMAINHMEEAYMEEAKDTAYDIVENIFSEAETVTASDLQRWLSYSIENSSWAFYWALVRFVGIRRCGMGEGPRNFGAEEGPRKTRHNLPNGYHTFDKDYAKRKILFETICRSLLEWFNHNDGSDKEYLFFDILEDLWTRSFSLARDGFCIDPESPTVVHGCCPRDS